MKWLKERKGVSSHLIQKFKESNIDGKFLTKPTVELLAALRHPELKLSFKEENMFVAEVADLLKKAEECKLGMIPFFTI